MNTLASRSFALRKVHSLAGVVPVGLFFLEHLVSNSYAVYGPERFDAHVRRLHSIPFLFAVELVFIILPILYHGFYGAYVTLCGQCNVGRYGYGRNWAYLLQRATGVVTLVFVVWHYWTLKLQSLLSGRLIGFSDLAELFANTWTALLYLAATVCAIYHFTNGLWGFTVSWGIVSGPRAQATLVRATWVLFAVLTAVTVWFVAAFAGW